MNPIFAHLLIVFFVLGTAITTAAALIWVERRLLALFQDRYGPNRVGPQGIFQVVADGLKMFVKEDWLPPFVDRPVFVIAPAIGVIAALVAFAVIPFGPGFHVADLNVGVLFVLAMSSLAAYASVLGGWASHSKLALIGAMRSASQMLSYEVFMGLALLGVVVQAGSFSLVDIVEAQRGLWFCIPQFLGLIVFFVAALAESKRLPFDLPEAEAELVAGYHVEYSGLKFGMFFVGEYIGVTLLSAFMTTLYFGGWLGPILPGFIWFFLKTFVLIGLFILIRGSLPRPRPDQLMAYGWKVMLPLALLNLLVTGGIVLATGGH